MRPRVCELFAGVGGFRLGLERSDWDVVWSNQWEPGQKAQYASQCYVAHFGQTNHINKDIACVKAQAIPNHDLLAAGFPCQDYSVATTKAEGIHGKKGVLWWEINRILEAKRPPYVLLENVDRLLRSPREQRGRDFGVMLWCLNNLGYSAEWRVINAADYGAPQKRRRVFVVATQRGTDLGEAMDALGDRGDWLERTGLLATAFPVLRTGHANHPLPASTQLPRNLQTLSDRFGFHFLGSGVMANGAVWSRRVRPKASPLVPVKSVLEEDVPEEYYIPESDALKWARLKGAKAEPRKAKNNFRYRYEEGAIPFPDSIEGPSRTIMTREGGLSPSRFKHVIQDPETKRLRVLTPLEVERLNEFPDGWTDTGMPRSWRYFCMGNALVVGLVERLGRYLHKWYEQSP